ncbi:MAG: SIR2 family protein [Ignavibacteriales bacterium]|nr:SIR2 family protein [Ignavibacteriales bacterium]
MLKEISDLIAQHKVVPFLGAGCSFKHLSVDWDKIRDEMIYKTSSTSSNHLQVAEEYVNKYGKNTLCEFLNKKLIIDKFDDEKGEIYVHIMSLDIPSIYSTNQDNVLEKCYEKYGRPINIIYDINGIANLTPSFPNYYKFHGDSKEPDTVVFTNTDYSSRIKNPSNPLDIRLKSDVLSKSIVFVGYSFRDPNIQLLFKELLEIFSGQLPKSYLIQYEPNKDFEKILKEEYGIIPINCVEEFENKYDYENSFTMFLSELASNVMKLKGENELEDLFRPHFPNSLSFVSKVEIDALNNTINNEPVNIAINAFRHTFDGRHIQETNEHQVAEYFKTICKRLTSDEHLSDVSGALFNLHLRNIQFQLDCLACAFAISIYSKENNHTMRSYRPTLKGLDENVNIIAAAMAIEYLREWGKPLNEYFYHFVNYISIHFPSRSELPTEIRTYIEEQFNYAYQREKTTYENPLNYADRTKDLFISKNVGKKIMDSMITMMPKKFKKPYS